MVFESIVADLLNRFGGQYLENLDPSHLKIGIWGGDIVLKDLIIKPTALDELNLPVRAVYGHIGKFILKIPWTNIYNAPVIATVEQLYVLIVPKTEVVYDAEKEEKNSQDTKQAMLLQVEEAKKREKEKDKPKAPDTFVEKLITQIIKNVQVKFSEIHIRYEDNYSQPNKPFSVGVTLHELSVHSTDDNWKKSLVPDAALKMIYKVLELKSLALYWNCETRFYPRDKPEALKKKLAESTRKKNPKNQYILAPINLKTQLRLNPKPENDGTNYSTPKILLGFTLQKLSLALSKTQYQDIIVFVDSLGSMSRAATYRKYRPDVPHLGHAKAWWRFAYTCVLETDVRRRRENWNWEHMHNHRNLCRKYALLYRAKLQARKVPAQIMFEIQEYEKKLDIFNIVLIRQSMEVEVEREIQKPAQSKGWFSGWFSSSSPKEDDAMTPVAIMKKFENAMTPEEKQKLYKAIDYHEASAPAQYPTTFVENSFDFELEGLSVEILDNAYDTPRVLYGELKSVIIHFEQRPSANAVKVVTTVGSFDVYGLRQGNVLPHIVSFQTLDPGIKLLDILFETNPMDGKCDQRLQVSSRPLEFVYDGMSVQKLADVFKTPQSQTVAELQAAAGSKLPDFKEMSAVGMQYAIEKHSILDINIDLSASHIILPYSGLYQKDKDQDLLLLNLGHLSIVSINQDRSELSSVKQLHKKGHTDEEIVAFMTSRSYDKFMIRLTDVQVLVVLKGEDWEGTLASHERCAMHLLEPTSLEVLLLKCLVSDDPRLPKCKVEAVLPSVTINVEDERILHLMSLLISISGNDTMQEETEITDMKPLDTLSHTSSIASDLSHLLSEKPLEHRRSRQPKPKPKTEEKSEEIVQAIDFQLDFILKDLSVALYKKSPIKKHDSELFLDYKMLRVVFQLVQRTWDLTIRINVGSVELNSYDLLQEIEMLSTPMAEGEDKYMFLLKYIQVNKNSPEFHSLHGSVVQLIEIDVIGMTLILHQEALLTLWEYARILQQELSTIKTKQTSVTKAETHIAAVPSQKTALPTIQEENTHSVSAPATTSRRLRRRHVTEAIDLKLLVKVFSFRVELVDRKQSYAKFSLEGGSVDVIVKKSYTEVFIKLKDLKIFDPNPLTKHHEILTVMGEEALSVQVVMFNAEMLELNAEAVDISVVVKTSAIRIFFLNWFVTRIMNFINPFKTMQVMLEEAAREAAETALQNVQDAYAKATRVSLNIDLQAPVIVIPASSSSIDALYFDMGTFTIKNRFEMSQTMTEGGQTAVIDEITIGLHDMKLLRVKLSPEEQVLSECVLLKPISCKVLVRRNLSCSWYKSVPDIDCSGRLETLLWSLSEDDYRMLLRIPSENMQESEELPERTEVADSSTSNVSHPKSKRPVTLESVGTEIGPGGDALPTQKPKSLSGPVTTTVKFTFTMDSLIVDLFMNGAQPETGDIHMNLQEKGLARFSLKFLSLKGHMYSDGTLSTSLLLLDCLLDDTRPDCKSKITRLMQRKTDVHHESSPADESENATEESFRSMLDVTFQQKGQDTFVDVRVFGFDLVMCTEYLMKIGDFFAGWTYQKKLDEMKFKPGKLVTVKSTRSSIGKPAGSKTTTSTATTPAAASKKDGMLTMNVRVEKPDIIMVEGVDDINTKAIVLNKELTLKVRFSDDHQVICGSIRDLQLYSCVYNPKCRAETTCQILRPCCISIAGSTPGGEGLHLDICLTPVRLSVSPATIELLCNVQKGLTVPEPTKFQAKEEQSDYSDMWQPKTFTDEQHWFLKTEVAEEASDDTLIEEPPKSNVQGELCIVSVSSIVVTVEAGVGNQTLPMILVDMSFNGAINNWSSRLFIDSCMSLEVKYYNSALALWEPMLEPVEVQQENGIYCHVPWELRLQMQMNPIEAPPAMSPTSESESEVEELHVQPPQMAIEISSKENLELTLSKTCMDVIISLGKSFQTALTGSLKRAEAVAPFTIRNDTGLAVAVLLEDSPFRVQTSSSGQLPASYQEVMLESGAGVELCLADPDIEDVWNLGLGKQTDDSSALEQYLQVKVIERNCFLSLPVKRADKRYFSLKHRGEGNEPWGLVSDVQVKDGGTVVTLRSIIQVHNHFNVPVNVYYMTKRGNEVECIGTVEHKEKLNVPLYAVYTPTDELFFSVEGYTVSVVPFVWKNLQNLLTTSKILHCDPKSQTEGKESFIMKIIGEMEQVLYENTTRHTMLSTCYNIHLRPTVIFKNHLPVNIVVSLANTSVEEALQSGQRLQLPTAEPGKCSVIIRIPEYLEKEWSCDHEIEMHPSEYSVWTFDAFDSMQRVSLDLGMRTIQQQGSTIMTLYCPYWMLNKTGLMLSYRKSRKPGHESSGSPLKQADDSANILYHPEHFKGPIMFSFKAKSFFGKKKASIKVEDSDWSDKFPLDVAGSSGLVHCKHLDVIYKVGVHIQLTYSSLTKQVTFTPYYVLLNAATFSIEVQEALRPADPWIKVGPSGCTALWPRCPDTKHLRARVAGSTEMTPAFAYDTVYTMLLRLDNQYGGLNVDVQMTEGSVYISFMSYETGLAPALIMNNLDVPVSYHEEDDSTVKFLEPKTGVMFTWSNPLNKKALVWASHKKKDVIDDLRKDGIGEFAPTIDKHAYWVSFLDGLQRILLFTYDLNLARDAQSAGEMERIDQEITLAIHGVGLSLVNNHTGFENFYCGLASSGVIWEMCKLNHKRFKPLNVHDTRIIEEGYVRHQQSIVLGEATPVQTLENGMEVDYEKVELLKPNHRRLRRTYNTGLWVQMKTSKHLMQLHAKVNRLQVDNQMPENLFPVVVAPVPLPRSIAANSAFKPFLELSVVKRLMEHSPVVQYKYFKALVQEFHIKVDVGFVNALLEFFEADVSDEDEQMRFEEDCKLVNEPLMAHALLRSSAEQKNFYDLLHFSPLKIHMSFSLSSASGLKGTTGQEAPNVISVLMQSLGVTLTDMQDVIFKLAYFERQYTFLTQKQLTREVSTHYIGQLLKQLYVLVLGLDVLGNPYGLVLGVAQGVEDLFYEPFQGAIQGPGEFAEGLVLGVRSLLGHTVGGAAGAVSRIAGAMGKGVAALTFDKDYQRKRREAISQRPANIQTGLAQSGKGLVMGVVAGVSGVFTKPVTGAREEGVEGFFKGVGKGVVGLVTRPTAGIIDFASGTLEQVKRAADPSEEVTRLRPPRFMHPDGQVRSYVLHAAQGNKLLHELEKGKYSSTDVYAFHMGIVEGAKDILLLTDKRIMYIVHNDVFGGWQGDWEYTWESLAAPPTAVERGIYITTGEPRKKVLGLFGTADKGGKIILIDDEDQREWLIKKMNEIMKN